MESDPMCSLSSTFAVNVNSTFKSNGSDTGPLTRAWQGREKAFGNNWLWGGSSAGSPYTVKSFSAATAQLTCYGNTMSTFCGAIVSDEGRVTVTLSPLNQTAGVNTTASLARILTDCK
jgi:hypothetical protein